MRFFIALTLYRLILPILFLAAFPGWVMKMLKRGGFGSGLGERVTFYKKPLEEEPCGAVHVHAISVGECLLALKLIRQWLVNEPTRHFVLATGTATGHAVASASEIPGLRVIYSPLDFRWMVRRYLKRFEPAQIVLIEGEVWPHLVLACATGKIRIRLVNARMSPRSTRRFQKFAAWLRPFYRLLDAVAIQESEDAGIWETLGIAPEKIHFTGSLKFDPGSGQAPTRQPHFQKMLDALGKDRPVILAVSTFPGEELLIANAIRAVSQTALPVIVPRHAERRTEVAAALRAAGFDVTLRSDFHPPNNDTASCLVIDSTGELRDWTAHADVVIVGKSFLHHGGQNPSEAILAGKPIILGPHMENFQPLTRRLIAANACLLAKDSAEITAAILSALNPVTALALTKAATAQLAAHDGATQRIVTLLTRL
jgi:3-deoxy-D-manno-octulosonic-acid transferase